MSARVANIDEVDLEQGQHGEGFAWRSVRIGKLLGAKGLGYSYDVVPPGKRACPFHSHRANEEMFFIVAGTGTLRHGDETRPIRAGDVICCPTGGAESAHQIINDSDAELRYLSVSTMVSPEVCEYPDSGKVLAYDGQWGHMTFASADLDYWDGES